MRQILVCGTRLRLDLGDLGSDSLLTYVSSSSLMQTCGHRAQDLTRWIRATKSQEGERMTAKFSGMLCMNVNMSTICLRVPAFLPAFITAS